MTALDHLKSVSIIQGDIKPENVDRHQQPIQVKLVDFGGARLCSPETLVYTRRYGSPEVLLASEIDEATDTWSLGLTATELALRGKLSLHDDSYNILRCIGNTIGQPPDRVRDSGTQAPNIFNSVPSSVPRWTLKTADQYECETNTTIVKTPGPFHCFDEIRNH